MNNTSQIHNSTGADSPGKLRSTMRLNIFQQLMRSWTTLGPYNAAQAMQLGDPCDIPRWQTAIDDVVNAIGLGLPQFQGQCALFSNRQAVMLQVCREPLSVVSARELNTPFAKTDVPLRVCIIPEGTEYWLLTIYDHWIADSWSIREFMRLILTVYDGSPVERLSVLRVNDQRFDNFFRQRRGSLSAPMKTLHAARRYFTHRRSWRFDLADPMDFSTGCSMHVLPDGTLNTLISCAKARQCRLNDIFLAAIAMVIGQLTAQSRYKLRRRWWAGGRTCVSIGSIVDIRDLADEPLDQTFGLFLSSCITTFQKPEIHTPTELIGRAARQTAAFKNRCGAIAAFGELAVVKYFSELYEQPRHKALFFQKNCPLLAGVSNVNLTGAWMDQRTGTGTAVQNYIRISPVGPLLPVVFALTTFHSRLSLCLTWRKAALTDAQAAQLAAGFMKFLEELKP